MSVVDPPKDADSPVLPGGIPQALKQLPIPLRRRFEWNKNGQRRAVRRILWAGFFLETGHPARSAIRAGYPKKQAGNIGNRLMQEFAPLLDEAMPYVRIVLEPLAVAKVREILERAYDPDRMIKKVRRYSQNGREVVEEWAESDPNFAGPQAAKVALAAAADVLDRGKQSRGLLVKVGSDGLEAKAEQSVWALLRALADDLGPLGVREHPVVKGRADFMVWLDEHYPVKPKEIEG